MAFTIIIKPGAQGDIQYYRINEQRIIMDAIATHLSDQPDVPTKKKKLLRPNALAAWELKVDIYRIFYHIDGTTVHVVAVGHKVHNTLYIRGQEVEL